MTVPEEDWREWIEGRLSKIEKEDIVFRAHSQMLDDIKTSVDGLGTKWLKFVEDDKKWKLGCEGRVQGLETVKQNKRYIMPLLVGLGYVINELVQQVFSK